MKKILLFIFIFVCFYTINVKASGVMFNPVKSNGKYVLEITQDNKKIDYQDAMKKYGLDNYLTIYIDGENKYFYQGIEIPEEKYLVGKSGEEADKVVLQYQEFGYRVHNSEEIINAIKDIYSSELFGKYHLIYTIYEKNDFDINYIENEYLKLYATDSNKNMYKYNEYGISHPIRFSPSIDEEIIINHNYVKTTTEEEKKVDKFLEVFLKEFNNKSEYEKVLGIYTYIKNTAKYTEDTGYENYLDGLLSPYDVLIKQKMVCIGAATTFQFLAEKLGINSYIVDHIQEISESEKIYNTTHTYNVVEINNKWYILDITRNNASNGFLIGLNSSEYNFKDFEYYNLNIEKKDYLETNNEILKIFEFDYEKYNKLIIDITENKEINNISKEIDKEYDDNENDSFIMYVVLFAILLIIFVIIFIFVRK